jgi:hypothetical protein
MALKIRRGTESQRSGITFAAGEIIWTTNGHKLFVGDGVTPGGIDIASQLGGNGITFDQGTGRLDIDLTAVNTDSLTEGNNNLYFTNQKAQAAVGTALTLGNAYNTGITFAYDDVNHRITAVVTAGGASLPDQTNNAGKFLTTNGAIASWATATGLPSQAGQNGHYLKTDGSTATWVALPSSIAHLQEDLNPTLGANLVLNNRNITGTGNINMSGTISTVGSIDVTGPIDATQAITVSSEVIGGGLIVARGLSSTTSTTAYIAVRGERTGQTTVQNGDFLGNVTIEGWNGTEYKKAAILQSTVTSSLAGGNFNSNFSVTVLGGDGGYRPFVFRHTGVFECIALKVTPVTTALIPSIPPETGAILYNTDVTSLQVYDGTAYRSVTTAVGVPGSKTAAGKVGQIAADANFMYVCYADNNWIRVAKDGTW